MKFKFIYLLAIAPLAVIAFQMWSSHIDCNEAIFEYSKLANSKSGGEAERKMISACGLAKDNAAIVDNIIRPGNKNQNP